MGDKWASLRSKSLLIASPLEEKQRLDTRVATIAGTKAAIIGCIASAIPTLAAVRTIPWAKANINHTGQAWIISAASVAAFVIGADKSSTKRPDTKR